VGKSLSELSSQDLGDISCLRPTDISDLSYREFERQLRQPAKSDAGELMHGIGNVFDAQGSDHSLQLQSFTREQFELQLREDAEKGKGPMTGVQFRQQQAFGVKPELANTQAGAPPTYEEFLAANYPHLLQQEDIKQRWSNDQAEVPPTQEEMLRVEALKELDRSQMPAVQGEDGLLVKTIEHYTFADSEDCVNFYVYFDKDLFPGAADFIQASQVKVESRSTSLDIRLQDVPVNAKNAGLLAEWRLTLSPLFSRVEASLTTHKVRNGKLSIKLYKAKQGAWKKGVKYS